MDISPTATARGTETAAARGVAENTEWVAHDLTTWEADQHFDLVTASFFHSEVELQPLEILRRGNAHSHGHSSHDHDHDHDQHDHGHSGHTMPTPAEELEQLALDPTHWEVVLQEIRPREMTTPDGTQTATIKAGVLLLRHRG